MSYKYRSIFLAANHWEDVLSHCDGLSTTYEKGEIFEELTELFLRLHPSYATKLSNVWRLRDLPEDIRIFLNLPIRDEGIDLIAQTVENEYWSVQCKYLTDIDHSIDRKYLSTFTDLSFGIAKNISFGLVATTADRFSHKLSMYEGRLGFMAGDIWRGLDSEFFELVHQYLTKHEIQIVKRKPRPHQVRAIERAKDYFSNDENTRGKLIMPCGTGKSLTGFWISETLDTKNILVALPSLSLIRQTLEVWTREALANNMAIRWIVVCSDDTVGENDNDDIAVLTQDLGILIDTNQDKISHWLEHSFEGKTVVFSTYQSGKITAAATQKSNVIFDLGIFDEAHKTVGKKGALFSHLLYDENISIKRRIFMTATERRYRGRSDEIASMDDPTIYGDDFEVLSFKEALEANPPILSDYKIITVVITRAEIAAMIENNIIIADKNKQWSDDMEAEMLAAVIALRKAMQLHPIRHAVSFHSSIKRSKLFQQAHENFNTQFSDYDPIETFHVSGKTPTAVRARSIQKFAKSDKALITNARCLTEGVDVPGIDAVLFADPRKSTVDIVQAVGRALRIFEGKQFGYVIVPVIIESDTLESLEDMGNYQAIIDVLRALAANDERIVEYFKEMSKGEASSRGKNLCSFEFSQSASVDISEFARALELKVWDKLGKLSWRAFDEAREFVHSLMLTGHKGWKEYCKSGFKPSDIPSTPNIVYLSQWKGINNWLGTKRSNVGSYLPYNEACVYMHDIGLKSAQEWKKWTKGSLLKKGKRPSFIPSAPDIIYKNVGWVSWSDWLGSKEKWMSFEEAREFVRSLELSGTIDWNNYCRGKLLDKPPKPTSIPSNASIVYAEKWEGIKDWLGNKYRSFEEARKYVHSLKLNGQIEWKNYSKGNMPHLPPRPQDIPTDPARIYPDEWKGVGDWVGTGRIREFGDNAEQWRSYDDAKTFIHTLELKSYAEWIKYLDGEFTNKSPLPLDIPRSPQFVYKDKGWINWSDWLGKSSSYKIKTKVKNALPFEEARTFVRSLGLKKFEEWQKYTKGTLEGYEPIPENIPKSPNTIYKNSGWIGIPDWLGTSVENGGRSLSYEEAKKFVHTLGLTKTYEWQDYCKGKYSHLPLKPTNIPATPWNVYQDKGYIGIADWLGTNS